MTQTHDAETVERIKWMRVQEVIRAAICFEKAVEGYVSETEYELDASLSEPSATISVCGGDALEAVKAHCAALSALPPREVSVQEAAKVLADAMEYRQWPFYVIEMPLTTSGNGPANVGFDAAKMTYEVWDAFNLDTKSTHENLPDAIEYALRAISEQKP